MVGPLYNIALAFAAKKDTIAIFEWLQKAKATRKIDMSQAEVAKLQAATARGAATTGSFGIGKGGFDLKALLFWAFVGIPLAWGVWKTLQSVANIF